MSDFPVIDVHLHIHRASAVGIQAMGGQPRVPGYTGIIEELLPLMQRDEITHVCMVNFTPVADMLDSALQGIPADATKTQRQEAEEQIALEMVGSAQRCNDWTCQVANELPNLMAFIGVDPVMDGDTMANEVIRCKDKGDVGIKLHTTVQHLPVNDTRLWPAYRAVEEKACSASSHRPLLWC